MIESITITVPPALAGYPQLVANVIPDIVEAMRTEIVRLAQERLRTSADDYIQNLSPAQYHVTRGTLPPGETVYATVVLSGWLPNAVENGWAGGDMKPELLQGRNAKTGKGGGRYNTVPFRHGTPGTSGFNFPEMGSAYRAGFRLTPGGGMQQVGSLTLQASQRLGRAVHRAAKQLAPTTSHPGRGTQWGGRLAAGVGGAGLLLPHHKTDIYAGMVRERKVYREAEQSQYKTFRRVSDKSDPRAWIHPGIEGHHLFREAATYGQRAAKFLFETAARGIVEGAR